MTAAQASQRAWVSLGSNLGPSRRILSQAIRSLAELSQGPLVCSCLRKTAPVDCPPGSPCFWNAVVGLVPGATETPQGLLSKLQRLERHFGRRRTGQQNEPRRLDLDLIAFRRRILKSPGLTLPHPRAHLRAFVLDPLVEVAPTYVLPGRRLTVQELRQRLG